MARAFWFCSDFERGLPRQRSQGFSLTEILVSVAILGVLTLALSEFLNAQLSGAVRYEDAARRIDDASRVRHLINMEIMEAEEISRVASDLVLPGKPGKCLDSDRALFRLKLNNPNSYIVNLKSLAPKYIYYQVRDSGIWRCGPPPSALGGLNMASEDQYVNMTQALNLSVNATVSSEHMLEYTLSSKSGSLAITSRAFVRSAQIKPD